MTRLRIATWNLERGGSVARIAEQRAVLTALRADVLVLTEHPAAPGSTCARTNDPEIERGDVSWAAIDGVIQDAASPQPEARMAVATGATLGEKRMAIYGSVLPWSAARVQVPDLCRGEESASELFARCVEEQAADIARLQREYEIVIWAGDFNQSLEGDPRAGSKAGRAVLEAALSDLRLVAWNRREAHAIDGLCAIDLICGPASIELIGTERFHDKTLSDHAGYVATVEI